MNQNIDVAPALESPGRRAKGRWANLVGNDDVDGDIERALGLYQAKYGYSREEASAELVRRLSLVGYGHAAHPLEDSCC